jgi:glycosyltransferase involved in cell wall biosynthesis
MTCSLVIRARNEEEQIARLLEGIRMQTIRDPEVILVDSGSTDSTVEIATHWGAKVVNIRPEEFTFGRSLNLGMESASSELVVIASAHVYPVFHDWLERLLEPFDDPRVVLSYGKQRGAKTTKFSEQLIFLQWFSEQSLPRQAHPFCNNANAAIRRSLWRQHAYDEALTGLEDVAWAAWAVREGYSLSYVAEAEVIHVHNETPRAVFNRYRREGMAFKQLYPEAHFSPYDFLRMSGGNIWSDLWHATRERALLRSLSAIFWFRMMQFWGTYQGYRHPGPVTARLRETFYYPRERMKGKRAERGVEPIRYNR